jgi:hypothetical protein
MAKVIAEVTIHAAPDGIGVDLSFAFPPTGDVVPLRLRDRRPLDAARDRAGDYLERAVRRAPRLNATAEQAADAFHALLGGGGQLVELLAGNRKFVDLQDAFRAAWPLWERADWGDPEAPLPIVQMDGNGDTLPLELLPVFDFSELTDPRTHDERVRAAARFLGFTAMVRRTVRTPTDADRVIRNDPALPVQFLRHRRLRSALREGRFLAGLGAHVRVEGPWPTSEDEGAVRAALLRALYDGDPLNGAERSDPPVQVHHFACHCDTTADLDDDYTLRLSTRRGRPRDISLGELRRAYRERFAVDRDDRRHRGIIVLNACASSATNPLTAASFAQWFVASGHRAFIGTETDVPDGVASGFAAAFYGRLLEARRPLGEAVVWARRDLLRDFRNPLGLLYVVYGDTDLTIERPRPGIYRAMA